jgi:3-deoxy-D-manno-octulosonic-acid transferase
MALLILGLYNLLATLLVWPLCLLVRRHPNFKDTLRLRLSLKLPARPHGQLIWFHGTSLGEVKGVAGLIMALKAQRPDITICLSTMTATGRQAAGSIAGVGLILPFPFDLAWVMRRYLRHLAPQALVIVETEIWPNLLMEAQKAGVRTLFVNARLSKKAFRRYQWIKPLTRRVFRQAEVLAIAPEDESRFKILGAQRVDVLGNLKFDAMRASDPDRARAIRASLQCGERPVFIAGSVREGEEAMVMDAIRSAQNHIPGIFSIIAPRHAERIPLIIDLAKTAGLAWGLRSRSGAEELLIIDTVGELFDLYGAAQAAFVGGSLVDLGGQNILEPIAWGIPTIHGPHMHKFNWALDAVKGHTIVVHGATELARTIADVLMQPERYAPMARGGREKLIMARGGTERYLDAILGRGKSG